MRDEFQTRMCHHCHRNSWAVAQNTPCPWCGRKTGKYHNAIQALVFFGSIAGILAAAYVAYQIGGIG